MALYVDWSKLNPPITEEEKDTPAFNVGMALMVCGLHGIKSEADLKEVLTRVRFFERLYGPIVADANGESMTAKASYWQRWIGVSINGTREPETTWMRRMSRSKFDEIEYAVRRELLDAVPTSEGSGTDA